MAASSTSSSLQTSLDVSFFTGQIDFPQTDQQFTFKESQIKDIRSIVENALKDSLFENFFSREAILSIYDFSNEEIDNFTEAFRQTQGTVPLHISPIDTQKSHEVSLRILLKRPMDAFSYTFDEFRKKILKGDFSNLQMSDKIPVTSVCYHPVAVLFGRMNRVYLEEEILKSIMEKLAQEKPDGDKLTLLANFLVSQCIEVCKINNSRFTESEIRVVLRRYMIKNDEKLDQALKKIGYARSGYDSALPPPTSNWCAIL